jgi:hypothetical protein
MNNIPVVTISCVRDLALQDLQAQGIFNYLDTECPVYIIVNETDPEQWFKIFDKSIRHYYDKHNLTILTLEDFFGDWNQWYQMPSYPWVAGWEKQQILKLLAATKVEHSSYLVLDCQNFLIRPWNPKDLYTEGDRVPTRIGPYVMPKRTWIDYSNALELDIELPSDNTMSICTPIFLATSPIKQMVEKHNGSSNFIDWFKSVAMTKSEFVLYLLWLKKNKEFDKYHFTIDMIKDWGHPYLRDCDNNQDFEYFIEWLGKHEYHCWASINFRAWGNMSEEKFNIIKEKLKGYNLFPNFDEFRSWYSTTNLK